MYSQRLFNAIKTFLIEDDWKYNFNEEQGFFSMGLNLNCKLKNCRILAVPKEDCIETFATINIAADEDKRSDIAEFITRLNYSLKFGCFQLDYNDGEIRYKIAIDCSDGMVPNKEIIHKAILLPGIMFEKYGDAILSILFGFATPKEAIEKLTN